MAEQKKTILIADDEVRMRRILCDYLSIKGYDVVEAADGVEAMEQLATAASLDAAETRGELEGVEDELTRNLLAEMGCDKLQGFLVGRPLPDDRLEGWLLARTGVRTAVPGTTHRRLFIRT